MKKQAHETGKALSEGRQLPTSSSSLEAPNSEGFLVKEILTTSRSFRAVCSHLFVAEYNPSLVVVNRNDPSL